MSTEKQGYRSEVSRPVWAAWMETNKEAGMLVMEPVIEAGWDETATLAMNIGWYIKLKMIRSPYARASLIISENIRDGVYPAGGSRISRWPSSKQSLPL